jgi:hypothetical protein
VIISLEKIIPELVKKTDPTVNTGDKRQTTDENG